MQFAFELDEEAIENIEEARNHLGDKWYQIMQEIIEENKGNKADYTIPKGIITGKLADNAENSIFSLFSINLIIEPTSILVNITFASASIRK